MPRTSDNIVIRPAIPADSLGVRQVLDAGLLSVASIEEQLDETLVAVPDDGRTTVIGAIVLVPRDASGGPAAAHIDAIAVRRRRQGQGIGSALVDAAADEYPVLTAAFDPAVRPFYEALSFSIRPHETDADRCWGRLDTTDVAAPE